MTQYASVQDVVKDTDKKMQKSVDTTKVDFSQVRTGRASAAMVEHVTVEYYGSVVPMSQVASVSAPEPRTLVIQPWDATALEAIEKAIQKADIGLNPNNDGKIIRITVPVLTEERRNELDKYIKKLAEEHRVSVRNIRREANEAIKVLKKDNKATEDDVKRSGDDIQKVTDRHIKHIDELLKHKESEIFEV